MVGVDSGYGTEVHRRGLVEIAFSEFELFHHVDVITRRKESLKIGTCCGRTRPSYFSCRALHLSSQGWKRKCLTDGQIIKAITRSAPLSASTPDVFRPLSVGKFMSYTPFKRKSHTKTTKKTGKFHVGLPRDPGAFGFKGISPSRWGMSQLLGRGQPQFRCLS